MCKHFETKLTILKVLYNIIHPDKLVTRGKAKSSTVVQHQRELVVLKTTSNVKGSGFCATLLLFSDFPDTYTVVYNQETLGTTM